MHEILLFPAAFLAGFIDSIAGGGGMVQVPALLFLYPNYPLASLLGTNKLAMMFGTSISAFHYVKALKINLTKIIPTLTAAFLGAILGASLVSHLDQTLAKTLAMVLLILIGIYLILRKQFGLKDSQKDLSNLKLQGVSILIGFCCGAYDGFLGPGTGSLLIFAYITLLGFSFLRGSAYSKLINLTTNIAAFLYFAFHGQVFYKMGLAMMGFNVLGNYVGARLAIKHGSGFVRILFLMILLAIIIKLLSDVLVTH